MSSRTFRKGLHYVSRGFESVCFECNAQTLPKSHSFILRTVTKHVVQASFVKLDTLAWSQSPRLKKKQSLFLFHLLVIFLCLYFPSGTQTHISGMGQVWHNTWFIMITHTLAPDTTLNSIKAITPIGKEDPK